MAAITAGATIEQLRADVRSRQDAERDISRHGHLGVQWREDQAVIEG